MATFTNQATLIYNGQSTSSNVTTGEILTGLTLTKTAITRDYGRDDRVAYIVTITNAGSAINDAALTDDLGAYTVGDDTVTPSPTLTALCFTTLTELSQAARRLWAALRS